MVVRQLFNVQHSEADVDHVLLPQFLKEQVAGMMIRTAPEQDFVEERILLRFEARGWNDWRFHHKRLLGGIKERYTGTNWRV
jgi:hypothetical protein